MFDDFGTGFAQLELPEEIPARRTEDRPLFRARIARPIPTTRQSSARPSGSRKQLGLSVIAEGIEDRATADFLVSMGCGEGQGYFFGRPMPASEFEAKFLHRRRHCRSGVRLQAA